MVWNFNGFCPQIQKLILNDFPTGHFFYMTSWTSCRDVCWSAIGNSNSNSSWKIKWKVVNKQSLQMIWLNFFLTQQFLFPLQIE